MDMYWKLDVLSAREHFSIIWFGIFYHADNNMKYRTSKKKCHIKHLNTCIGLYGAGFPSVHHSSFVRFTSYSFIGHSTPSCFFLSSLFARPQIVGQHNDDIKNVPNFRHFCLRSTVVWSTLFSLSRWSPSFT